MSFVWPTALIALALVPLLAGVYVWMQQRRKAYTVRFTNLSLLRDVDRHRTGCAPPRAPGAVLAGHGRAADQPGTADAGAGSAAHWRRRHARARRLGLDGCHRLAANASAGAATTAARQFIESLPDGTRVGVVSFSQGASVVAPLSSRQAASRSALQRLRANGGTAIGDGLNAALTQLAQTAQPIARASATRAW